MDHERAERKLTAILAADIAGYSRLMGADEEGTLARLKDCRRALIDPKIAEHRGRLVKTTGDGLLVEFASVVDAVRCAIDIQQGMAARNAEIPAGQRIEFRIGINVGDIIIDGDDIYGDGVNVAARLEQLAEPGGILASRAVRDQARDRVAVAFEDLGERQVKNIARPIKVHRLRFDGAPPPKPAMPEGPIGKRRRWLGAAAAALALVAVAAAAAGFYRFRQPPAVDRPSIAVLPFANLDGNPQDDYFSNGLSADIITELARFPALIVIARNSTARFKGQANNVQEIGRQLGAAHVLEGSVQRSGERIRVTAQLSDAITGASLWAERYDRPMGDVFAIQDDLVAGIVGVVAKQLRQEEIEAVKRQTTSNLTAYDLFLRGRAAIETQTPAGVDAAYGYFQRALAADPNYAEATAYLARIALIGFTQQIGPFRGPTALDRAAELAKKSIRLNENSAIAHAMLGYVLLFQHRHDEALDALKLAVRINPNDEFALIRLGETLTYSGRPEEGLEAIRKSMRIDPFHSPHAYADMGRSHLMLRQYDLALDMLKVCTTHAPDFRACYDLLAVAYAEMDRGGEAQQAIAELRRIEPGFRLADAAQIMPFKNQPDLDRFLAGLRKAGLPA
ncbi:MAG: hypothetical protein HY057_03100 [Rhodospirillales bacterium]|nr:hypothetical protein [Rhodospirillales bacterium]